MSSFWVGFLVATLIIPCLLIVGDEDTTIPASASRALFESWTGHLSEFVVRQSGHRGVLKRADVHQALADFLRR